MAIASIVLAAAAMLIGTSLSVQSHREANARELRSATRGSGLFWLAFGAAHLVLELLR